MAIDKSIDLSTALAELRRQDLEKLVSTIETDRLMGGTDLPHASLLSAVRPALKDEVDMPRLPTPQRMFCRPFEDLLPEPGQPDTTDQISRTSIEPMWDFLKTELGDEFDRLVDEISNLALAENMSEAWERVHHLQEESGARILKAIEIASREEEKFQSFCSDRGGESVVNDMREMAMCLEIARTIHRIQEKFERPICGYDGPDLMAIAEEYKGLVRGRPTHTRYLLYVLMGRMARPWEIMMLISALTDSDGNFLVSQIDRSLMGELILTELDLVSAHFENIDADSLDKEDFLKHLNCFVQLTGGLRHASSLDRSNNWSYRLRLNSERVAKDLASLAESMPELIMAALPMKNPGGYGLRVPKVPEVSTPPKAKEVELSLRMMRLFNDLRLYADQTGFSRAYEQSMDRIDSQFERYKKSILEHLLKCEGEEKTNSIEYANLVADLAGEMNRPDEANVIRERVELVSA